MRRQQTTIAAGGGQANRQQQQHATAAANLGQANRTGNSNNRTASQTYSKASPSFSGDLTGGLLKPSHAGVSAGASSRLASHVAAMSLPISNINNAPTSLTNLAQLSGITLMPMDARETRKQTQQPSTSNISLSNLEKLIDSHRPNNNAQFSTSKQTRNNFMTSAALNNKLASRPQQNSQQQQNQQRLQQSLQQRQPSTSAGQTRKPVYNLASIPSIQLINQTNASLNPARGSLASSSNSTAATSSSQDPFAAGRKLIGNNSVINLLKTQSKPIQQQPKTTTNTYQMDRINYRNNFISNQTISKSNEIQVIPVSESMPIFSSQELQKSTQMNTIYNDIAAANQTKKSNNTNNHDSIVIANTDGPSSNEANGNISLMKLMSIFSNPALTITPVNSSSTDDSTFPPHRGFQNTNYNQQSGSCSMYNDNRQQAAVTQRQALQHRNIQQSIAKLQRLNENLSFAAISSVEASNLNSGSNRTNEIQGMSASHTIEPVDSQLGWLKNQNLVDIQQSSWSSMDGKNDQNSYDPTVFSTSVRNLIMQQSSSNSKPPTVSVQLLKQIADQTQNRNDWDTNSKGDKHKSVLEPECIIRVHRDVQQMKAATKRTEITKYVTVLEDKIDRPKQQIATSAKRLYIPVERSMKKFKSATEPHVLLSDIEVLDGEEKEVYLSDQHFMLDSMMAEKHCDKQATSLTEPDEIFINRSKRIMSKIDTMLERKKRKRFERISSRADPKTNSIEDQCAESEDEWSSIDGDNQESKLEEMRFVRSQLPLDELESNEKRDFFSSVGLVSRTERNRILTERDEKKFNLITPLATDSFSEVTPDIRRFVDTIVQTGGGPNVQLTTDSNIKRNDLPLIEGLNRNTSRLKMNYMNVLGLEKRSKRTTLYKVVKSQDSSNNIRSNDINNSMDNHNSTSNTPATIGLSADLSKIKLIPNRTHIRFDQRDEQRKLESQNVNSSNIIQPMVTNANAAASRANKLTLISCREALKKPPENKNDYMKSLGLIAS